MTPIEALAWIFENFDEDMKPFEATMFTDTQTIIYPLIYQSQKYWCFGCRGIFRSVWPEWKKPTDDTFPHEDDCKYMAAKRLLAQALGTFRLKCKCGWKPGPGALIHCEVIGRGPYYCPDCGEIMEG